MDFKQKYQSWLDDDYFDKLTKDELSTLSEKEIEDRFYKDLDFGTGGLRGVIGAGTNRMNIYTVSKATQGLANYILKQGTEKKGVCIAYDSRRFSKEFALVSALVLAGNGIKAYVFESLRPTPVLSFAVRYLKATSGIVVTASHNPPEYNGYKVYWDDGGQVPYPRDAQIIEEVYKVSDFKDIKKLTEDDALSKNLLVYIGKQIDDAYTEEVKKQCINKDIIAKMADSTNIIYTPLHGSGNLPVRRVLEEIGFKNINIVKEQELPDENFTTVGYPNPESENVYDLAIKLSEKINADVILATDPDCDRVGVVVKDSNGDYKYLTGNMTGVILTEYLLTQLKANNKLPQNPAVISTIVSTGMTKAIAESNQVKYIEVLTGFKYIGEKIKEFEQTNSNNFIIGFEESYGYLVGTYARDKDAVVASMLICEACAYYKSIGKTLYDALQDSYKKYGFYKESIKSIDLKGIDGIAQIKKIMADLRAKPPTKIADNKICVIKDYLNSIETNFEQGKQVKIDLPVSDVLYYVLDDESWFCVRPSGTEPKIKIYFGVKSDSLENADEKLKLFSKNVVDIICK